MSHFLVTATDKEIFDAVYMGLKSQGFEKSSDGEACLYTSEMEQHCAIGWACMLSKSEMPMEGRSVKDSLFWLSMGVPQYQVPESREKFLFELQTIHDSAISAGQMKIELEKYALKHNLTVPSFDVPRLVLESV